MLIAALIITIILKEDLDSLVIGIVIIANSILGFIQEFRSKKVMAALQRMLSLKARVCRNGEIEQVDASELVPGDVMMIDTGDKVPADCRLLEASELKTQEAGLTGESLPVADRTSMIFASSASFIDWVWIIGVSSSVPLFGEIVKLFSK